MVPWELSADCMEAIPQGREGTYSSPVLRELLRLWEERRGGLEGKKRREGREGKEKKEGKIGTRGEE